MERLTGSKEDLEVQLAKGMMPEIDACTMRAYVADFSSLIDEGMTTEKRAFIRSFVRQLTVKEVSVP